MDIQTLHERFGEHAEAVLSNAVIIAESYTDAALVLNIELEDVENAIINAASQYGGCVACRYSRASRNADAYARQRGSLPITMRGCILGLSQTGCSSFEPIIPGR